MHLGGLFATMPQVAYKLRVHPVRIVTALELSVSSFVMLFVVLFNLVRVFLSMVRIWVALVIVLLFLPCLMSVVDVAKNRL